MLALLRPAFLLVIFQLGLLFGGALGIIASQRPSTEDPKKTAAGHAEDQSKYSDALIMNAVNLSEDTRERLSALLRTVARE